MWGIKTLWWGRIAKIAALLGALVILLDIIGADHMVYGSNFGGSDAVRHDLTDGLKLSDEDLQKIRWKNACGLLHLDPAKLGVPNVIPKAAIA